VFLCQPISAFWDQVNFLKIASGTYQYECLDEGAEIVANGILSTIQVKTIAYNTEVEH
jgi:hypothetical protein